MLLLEHDRREGITATWGDIQALPWEQGKKALKQHRDDTEVLLLEYGRREDITGEGTCRNTMLSIHNIRNLFSGSYSGSDSTVKIVQAGEYVNS